MNIKDIHNWQLLQLYTDIREELQQRNVIRTSNLLGDYAEYLVASAFSLTLMPNSSAGYDAFDTDQVRYQVKGRMPTEQNKSREMGSISGIEKHCFDWLAGVIFNTDFTIHKACLIPYATVLQLATCKKGNKHILFLRDAVWDFDGVIDVTQRMVNHQNELNEAVQLPMLTPAPEL